VFRNCAIDSSKLEEESGWEPTLQFEEGTEKTVAGTSTIRRGSTKSLSGSTANIASKCIKMNKI